MTRPLIGVTLDAEPPGGWSRFPWYALRANYTDAIAAAGGLPVALPHDPALAVATLDRLDGLVVTGGAFDVDPALYGDDHATPTVTLKEPPHRRRAGAGAGRAGARHAGAGHLRRTAAAGGGAGRHADPAYPRQRAGALEHEQPNPRDQPGHPVAIVPGTLLHRIVGADTMQVNSAHHQAVAAPGRTRGGERHRAGRRDRGGGGRARRFCLGLQWHPEFLIDPGDRRVFDAFVAACA